MISLIAPILPNESLGNIVLRENIKVLLQTFKFENIVYLSERENIYSKTVTIYKIFNDAINIAVDNRNSKIFRISASKGYEAKLFDKIMIGDTLFDVIEKEKSFYYSERDDVVLSKKFPGVSLDLEISDFLFSDIKNPKIEYISVYAVESMTVQGQMGNW